MLIGNRYPFKFDRGSKRTCFIFIIWFKLHAIVAFMIGSPNRTLEVARLKTFQKLWHTSCSTKAHAPMTWIRYRRPLVCDFSSSITWAKVQAKGEKASKAISRSLQNLLYPWGKNWKYCYMRRPAANLRTGISLKSGRTFRGSSVPVNSFIASALGIQCWMLRRVIVDRTWFRAFRITWLTVERFCE